MKKILTFIPNLNQPGHSMCKFCLSTIKDHSKYDIDICWMNDINDYDLNSYDILHIHQTPLKQFFETDAKIIYDVHNYVLNCPAGGNICQVLNKYLKDPLVCTNCLGKVGTFTGFKNMENIIKFAKRADRIATHSLHMTNFYHEWNPVTLPLPLQTDLLIPCYEKEDYLLYSGRFSLEKNPWGFVKIIEETGYKGKMLLYELSEDIANTKSSYKKLLEKINKNPNIDVIINPTIPEMIELVKHAKFTVLPYFFAEPYGIAAANSVMCGTPLITFPYGNARNMTHLLPKTLDEMIQMVKMDENKYLYNLELTIRKGNELRQTHNPKNATKIWDNVYDKLLEK